MKNNLYRQKYCDECRKYGKESIGYIKPIDTTYCVKCWVYLVLIQHYSQFSENTDEAVKQAKQDVRMMEAVISSESLTKLVQSDLLDVDELNKALKDEGVMFDGGYIVELKDNESDNKSD